MSIFVFIHTLCQRLFLHFIILYMFLMSMAETVLLRNVWPVLSQEWLNIFKGSK